MSFSVARYLFLQYPRHYSHDDVQEELFIAWDPSWAVHPGHRASGPRCSRLPQPRQPCRPHSPGVVPEDSEGLIPECCMTLRFKVSTTENKFS